MSGDDDGSAAVGAGLVDGVNSRFEIKLFVLFGKVIGSDVGVWRTRMLDGGELDAVNNFKAVMSANLRTLLN